MIACTSAYPSTLQRVNRFDEDTCLSTRTPNSVKSRSRLPFLPTTVTHNHSAFFQQPRPSETNNKEKGIDRATFTAWTGFVDVEVSKET